MKNRLRLLCGVLCILVLIAGMASLAGCGGSTTETSTLATTTDQSAQVTTTDRSTGGALGSLEFPVDGYTVQTIAVKTADGDKEVTYHHYGRIIYVTNPVDADYQSMDVSVPVKIDGVDVDATNAPILFDIAVGGYLAAKDANSSKVVASRAGRALAAGCVVVSPGCRGRDNARPDGTYYGKAPAAIVDLKCAVKYLRANKGVIPGNTDWIVSTGVSAGGALSALLGASGDSDLYDPYFEQLGAADASDAIFASACFCPIMDLEHADMAYEWMFGATPQQSGLVDQALSKELKDAFATYQASLNLQGKNGFGTLTADNYADYLLKTYLVPAANKDLSALSDNVRTSYLAKSSWITWANSTASFSFADFVAHVGRMKGLPAFDSFKGDSFENVLFGNETTDARHFTDFSLRHDTGDSSAEIDGDLKTTVNVMNPMYFIGQKNGACVNNWWLRVGTSDNHTSLTVMANLAASLENQGKNVNALMYWDAMHGANEDPEDFIKWIGELTGYSL